MNPPGGYAAIAQNLGHGTTGADVRTVTNNSIGVPPKDDLRFLLTASEHSGTPLEIVAGVRCALVLIGAALSTADKSERLLSCTDPGG